MPGIIPGEEVHTPEDLVQWLLAAEDCLCERMRNLEDVINQRPIKRVEFIFSRCPHMNQAAKDLVKKVFKDEQVTVKLNAINLFKYIAGLRGWRQPPPYFMTIRPPQIWAS